MHHDIPDGALCMASIKKWAMIAEKFQPVGPVKMDTLRLQHQIEELSAKLVNTQMWVVSERRKNV